jgi:hypothetical protein
MSKAKLEPAEGSFSIERPYPSPALNAAHFGHPLPRVEREKRVFAEDPCIHLTSQESLSFLLDGRVKPGHDGRVKSR